MLVPWRVPNLLVIDKSSRYTMQPLHHLLQESRLVTGEVFGEAVGWPDFGVFGGSYGPFVCIPLFDDPNRGIPSVLRINHFEQQVQI